MNYIDLGGRIRRERVKRNWTQEALGERIHVSTSFVGHVERGSRKASLETLVSIANALGVSVDYLLDGSLNQSLIGRLPKGLDAKKREALKNILNVIHENLDKWEGAA